MYISSPKRNAGAAVLRAEPASKGPGTCERVQASGEAGLVAARGGTCTGTSSTPKSETNP